MRRGLVALMLALGATPLVASDSPPGTPRALIVDYELRPADYSNALIQRLAAAGFAVDYRQYDPQLARSDFAAYALIALIDAAGPGGSELEPSRKEISALKAYTEAGGLLILGLPSSSAGFAKLGTYNRLLSRLGAGIRAAAAFPEDILFRYNTPLLPYLYFHSGPGAPAAWGVQHDLVLDRGPILEVSAPALVLARTSTSASAVAELWGHRHIKLRNQGGYPMLAVAPVGKGGVLAAGSLILNAPGYNGVASLQPMTSMDWTSATVRFLGNVTSELVSLAGGTRTVSVPATPDLVDAARKLPAAPRDGAGLVSIPAGGSLDVSEEEADRSHRKFLAGIRRAPYAQILDQGLRAGWTEADRDDLWLNLLASRAKEAGLNSLWANGFPERLLPGGAKPAAQAALLHSWETLAAALANSSTTWTVGLNYPGVPTDDDRYERSRGPDGKKRKMISPLDERLWDERIIPEIETVARFSASHPAVSGATLDLEMYGFEPLGYTESAAFEDAAYGVYLRAAAGKLAPALLAEASGLKPSKRFAWLGDHGLLGAYFSALEAESEALGRRVRERARALDPDFVFGVYLYGMADTWFYRGFLRGLGTSEMPVVWMSFQAMSAPDLERFRRDGRFLLHAPPLLLGAHPLNEYADVIAAARRWHDGYWINHLTKLLDLSRENDDIEAPQGRLDDAWDAIQRANRRQDARSRAKP